MPSAAVRASLASLAGLLCLLAALPAAAATASGDDPAALLQALRESPLDPARAVALRGLELSGGS